MKKISVCVLALGLGFALPSRAAVCALDVAPARTRGVGKLGSIWAVAYDISNGARTEIIVWREIAGTGSFDVSAACDGPGPNGWYPHGQTLVTVADEAGTMQEILVDGSGESVPGFPFAAGRYEIGRGGIAVPYKKGTMYLDLSDAPNSWVGVRRSFNSTKRQGRAQAVPIVPIECSSN